MREEIAKTKWCPMVKHIQFEGCIVDSRGDYFEGEKQCRCVGSECMMWVTNGFSNVGDCGLKREPEANG